jgi:flagellar hook-basal body complex protein FliE
MLARSLNDVNQLKLEADEAVANLAAGKQKDIHATMIALEKADVAFQLLMQVRNKIISAYETVMRMQA